MIVKFFTGRWSPYLSGIIVALLFCFGLYLLDSPLGMGDAYLMISEYCREAIGRRTMSRELLERFPFDWQTGFLIGIFLGGLIAAIVGGKWKFRFFPEGGNDGSLLSSSGLSPLVGIAGGFLVMLGLQLSGDSFFGQWAAAMQLSASAWVFFASVAIWGVVFTALISLKTPASGSRKKETD